MTDKAINLKINAAENLIYEKHLSESELQELENNAVKVKLIFKNVGLATAVRLQIGFNDLKSTYIQRAMSYEMNLDANDTLTFNVLIDKSSSRWSVEHKRIDFIYYDILGNGYTQKYTAIIDFYNEKVKIDTYAAQERFSEEDED